MQPYESLTREPDSQGRAVEPALIYDCSFDTSSSAALVRGLSIINLIISEPVMSKRENAHIVAPNM